MPSSDGHFDPHLDAELRSVPVPADLVDRLRAVAVADDEDLDAVVRDVRLPAGLLGRLRRVALETDEGLDAALREIRVPGTVLARLRRIPARRQFVRRAVHWAAAASLLVAVGFSYVAAMVLLLLAAYRVEPLAQPDLAAWTADAGGGGEAESELQIVTALPDEALAAGPPAGRIPLASPPVEFAPVPPPMPSPLADSMRLFRPSLSGDGAEAFLDATPYFWPDNLYGSPLIDDLPELPKVAGPAPKGVSPPLVPGFPLDFFIRNEVHPFVHPAANPGLETSQVPLDVDRASYELTRRYLEDGHLPAPEAIRTEEFLAAVEYGFPAPKRGALGLTTACGPSPFGGQGLALLQLGVQARQADDPKRAPVRLVLAVDVSASMRWGGRLEMVRQAIGKLAPRLKEADRVSLVAFADEARTLIEDARPVEADQILAAAAYLSAGGWTNVGAGLREAYTAAAHLPEDGGVDTIVVLLTDGTGALDRGTSDKIEQRLRQAAARNVRLEVIDLGQGPKPDRLLAELAAAGGGQSRRAASADQIHLALAETITGRSQMVAADARLAVRFNPKTVIVYRLIGHERSALAGLWSEEPQADLYSGQSGTALYELQLKPGAGQEVATVELSWQPPGGGERQVRKRTVRINDFVASFVEAPLSVQEAALVAQAAEILRHSVFARLPHNSQPAALLQVRRLADQADTRLFERPSFVEFLSVVERAAEATPYRGGGGP
jgi:hypothetical protein